MRRAAALLLLVLGGCSSALPSVPASAAAAPARAGRPRLAVIVVVDQLRADYLERFAPHFTGGFKRLIDDGRLFANAHFEQWPAVTAAGHATISTGATPADHGIVGNSWYDRAERRDVDSVADPNSPQVPGGGRGASPWRLRGSTISDELKLATRGRGKVVSVALKDRSAILLGGRGPDAALWFDEGSGSFVTSRFYGERLPTWVERFNASRPADRFFGMRWDLLLPEAAYADSGADDGPDELPVWGGRTFPHLPSEGLSGASAAFYGRVVRSPFGNELLVAAARAALEGEALGTDEITDLLCVSFSSNDYVGHAYGPYSREVQDLTLRTDLALGALMELLDAKVGKDGYVLVLTSDHGVAPTPSDSAALGGRYMRTEPAGPAIDKALEKKFGAGPWLLSVSSYMGVNLNRALAEERGVAYAELERAAAEEFRRVAGVRSVFTASELASGRAGDGSVVARRVGASYYPERSADLIVILEPFVVPTTPGGASHGTPYTYDSHVPVIFYGPGVAEGIVTEPVAATDVAPTLSALLGLTPPSNSTGRPLMMR
jgi:predicted AlkP superfamily pyrophosphatase or phosphodiesterase